MEAYNLDQTAFGENFNYGIKDFLDKRKLADKYLAPSLNFSASFSIPNNQKRLTGWNPTTSKKFLFELFLDYCNETYEIEQQDGTIKLLKGVQMIDDIGLLEEIIQWSENLNVDRITSAMGCVAYAHYLRTADLWKPLRYKKQVSTYEPSLPKQAKKVEFFRKTPQRSFYKKR
jgi:hypothetical protein